MKKIIIISLLSILFFVSCTNIKSLNGTYSDGRNIEFKFNDSTKEFEYFFKSEMGLLQYSKGKWELNKNKLHLSGPGKNDLKQIAIESIINNNENNNKTKVEIQCGGSNADTYIKYAILINDNLACIFSKDTVISLDYKVEAVQIKSYLYYSGLLSSNPVIDTLYSSIININNENNVNKNIVLKFKVHLYDFFRVRLTNTLHLKNNHTLYLNKVRLNKQSNFQDTL